MQERKEDFGFHGNNDRPAQNSPLESEQVRVPYQQRKSMQNPDGWISGPRETSNSGREGRGAQRLRGTAVRLESDRRRGEDDDGVSVCRLRLGGSGPGLVLGLRQPPRMSPLCLLLCMAQIRKDAFSNIFINNVFFAPSLYS